MDTIELKIQKNINIKRILLGENKKIRGIILTRDI